jgi:hypothetical protein
LDYIRKSEDKTIGEHLRTFKSPYDNLAAIGKLVSDKEKVSFLLTSLGSQYELFIITMLKPPRPSYSQLVSQLQSFDQSYNWFSGRTHKQPRQFSHQLAFFGQQKRAQQLSSPTYGKHQSFNLASRGFQAQQS